MVVFFWRPLCAPGVPNIEFGASSSLKPCMRGWLSFFLWRTRGKPYLRGRVETPHWPAMKNAEVRIPAWVHRNGLNWRWRPARLDDAEGGRKVRWWNPVKEIELPPPRKWWAEWKMYLEVWNIWHPSWLTGDLIRDIFIPLILGGHDYNHMNSSSRKGHQRNCEAAKISLKVKNNDH